jgi:hypothetical protein
MSFPVRKVSGPVFFSTLLLTLSIITGANADVYECRDPHGAILFTDTPTRSGCRILIGQKGQGELLRSFSPSRFDDIILSASGRYGVDPDLVRAVIKAESDFNAGARSHKGAQGLMQLMPETARLYNVSNVYDPEENVDGGVRHLRWLLDFYQGDLQLSLAAYNAGIQAVERYGGIPPYSETREYIRRVLAHHKRYRSNGQISIKEQASR